MSKKWVSGRGYQMVIIFLVWDQFRFLVSVPDPTARWMPHSAGVRSKWALVQISEFLI